MKVFNSLVFAFILFSYSSASVILESSPCPRLFVYERSTTHSDRWYGIITLLSDSQLSGIWLRVTFDHPIIQFGNWFGQVVKKSSSEYLVKNQNFVLRPHTPQIIRFFVKYNVNAPVPKLTGFKLNAKTVCPEDIITTTPTTTTEQLFTNEEENAPILSYQVTGSNLIPEDDTTTEYVSEHPLFISLVKPREPGEPSEPADTVDKNICGTVSVEPEETAPQVSYKGQYPWHVALYYTKDIMIAYLCGASLISDEYILTVAHCIIKGSTQSIVNPDRLVVYLGKYYLKHWSQEGTQTRYVSKIVPHPDYKADTNTNDIAVIRMTNPVEFSDYVRPICLGNGEMDKKVGSVVGWGFDEAGRIEDKLMYVNMAIQSHDVCNASIANYSVKFTNDNTYCASFLDGTLECVGDSGGGMVFQRSDGVWQIRGVVTISVVLQHQLKCGPKQYVVFTDVTKYEKWIQENLAISQV